MSKANRCIKGILIVLFFLLLVSGFILLLTGYKPQTELYGYYTGNTEELPTESSEIVKGIGTGSLFSQIENNYNESYPFRPIAIKLNNTVDFLQGKSSNDNVWYGKDHELYEYEYISDCLMIDDRQNGYYNEDKIKGIVEELAFIRDALRDMNKEVYVLITPNKAVFTKEHIPDELMAQAHEEKEGAYTRNVVMLKEQLEKNDISYFDSTAYIQNRLPENVIPFYRSGIHYSWPTGYYIAQEMFRDIEQKTGLVMPRFTLSVEEQDEVVFPNHDLYDLLNTLQGITDFAYRDKPQQQVYIDNIQESPVKVLMQGGSFLGAFIDMLNRYTLFNTLDIIQNQMFVQSDHTIMELQAITDVNPALVLHSNLFIFEVNEDAASGMSFGFIHHLYEYLRGEDNTAPGIPASLSFSDPSTYAQAGLYGIYDLDATSLPWRFTAQEFGCTLQTPRIRERGLQFAVTITDDLRSCAENNQVMMQVSINGQDIGSYAPDDQGYFLIPAEDIEDIPATNDIYQIDCKVNTTFNPHALNPDSMDMRDLAIILYSVSAAAPGRAEK